MKSELTFFPFITCFVNEDAFSIEFGRLLAIPVDFCVSSVIEFVDTDDPSRVQTADRLIIDVGKSVQDFKSPLDWQAIWSIEMWHGMNTKQMTGCAHC